MDVYTVYVAMSTTRYKQMQDYETSQDSSQTLEEENSKDQVGEFLKVILKRVLVFICFGPGVLGVLWIIGRLFKR